MGKQKPHHCLRNLQNLALMSLTRKLEADSWVAEKSAAYRKIKQLETELERAKRQARKYKKWLQRMNTSAAPDTPRTKTRKLLADCYQCKQSVLKNSCLPLCASTTDKKQIPGKHGWATEEDLCRQQLYTATQQTHTATHSQQQVYPQLTANYHGFYTSMFLCHCLLVVQPRKAVICRTCCTKFSTQ